MRRRPILHAPTWNVLAAEPKDASHSVGNRASETEMTQLQISRNHPSGHSRHTAHIPHTMPAAAIDHFGGPEVLTLHNVPVPSIDEKEVLIALDTAGVGPWDADIREGWYPPVVSRAFRWCLGWMARA